VKEAEARIVIRTMIRAMALLDDSVLELQSQMDEVTFDAYKRVAGTLMGSITIDVMQGLYAEFPSLEPRSVAEWIDAGELTQPHWLTQSPDRNAK
jgi:hypothetical protein